jgi:prevent-host-death family protein
MTKIKEIGAGEFKAKCLQLMDTVQKTKAPLIITKHGKPVAKLVPVDGESVDFFGCMKGSIQIVGDIISPIDVEWEANA